MPIDLMYDISVEQDPQGYGKCIRAPEYVFRAVAGILLKLSTEKPDAGMANELNGFLVIDHAVQASFFSFALQCLGDALCGESSGGDDMLLRQKPDDTCILQQFQDDTWVDVFDYGLCFQAWQTIGQETDTIKDQINGALPAAIDLWKDFQDKYTGTSASYDPALTIESGNELTNRAALCAALKEQLDNYVAQSIKGNQAFTESLSRGALAISGAMAIIAIVAALIAFPIAAPAVFAWLGTYLTVGTVAIAQASLGLSTVALAVWVQKVKDVDLAILQSDEAKDAILCIWYEALKNEEDISLEDYQTPLDMSSSSSDAQTLYDTIKPLIDQGLSYAAFLKMWKQQIEFGAAGITLDLCTCEEYPIEFVIGSSSYPATGIEFKGINGANQAIWELTLESTGLNAADAIYVRSTNLEHTFLNVYIRDTIILSGGIGDFQENGVSYELDGGYDPSHQGWAWIMYVTDFPLRVRLVAEMGTN
jgi:hypothetical protein